MLKAQRQNAILESLRENGILLISDLAEQLNCSLMTIRRDVDEMKTRSLVKKIHGGVEIYNGDDAQPSFNERVVRYSQEKRRIAAEAVKFIEKGSTVFFDAGTTSLYVVQNLPIEISFTAITNSLMTAVELCNKPNVTAIMLGGELHHSSYSSVNNIAIEAAKKFNTDLAIISTKSISLPDGLFETMLPLIEIKRTMVKYANKVLLLADHSKFNESAMCLSIPLNDIDHIITDRRTQQEKLELLKKLGVAFTIV